jgi:hypothetical protein
MTVSFDAPYGANVQSLHDRIVHRLHTPESRTRLGVATCGVGFTTDVSEYLTSNKSVHGRWVRSPVNCLGCLCGR